jgi:hypothetical protein
MAKTILQVTTTEKGLLFVDPKDNKVVEATEFEDAEAPEASIRGLRQEIKGRGAATRHALNLVLGVLDGQRMDGYRGQVQAHERIPAEIKTAMREAEDLYIKPLLVGSLPKSMQEVDKNAEWDSFIKMMREPGIYARVRGIALKYFTIHGRLPCMYDMEGKPNKEKLMPVSAMERLMDIAAKQNPKQPIDHSINAELVRLIARIEEEKTSISVEALTLVISNCERMAREAKELINLKNQGVTEALHGLVNVEGVMTGAPQYLPPTLPAETPTKPAPSKVPTPEPEKAEAKGSKSKGKSKARETAEA